MIFFPYCYKFCAAQKTYHHRYIKFFSIQADLCAQKSWKRTCLDFEPVTTLFLYNLLVTDPLFLFYTRLQLKLSVNLIFLIRNLFYNPRPFRYHKNHWNRRFNQNTLTWKYCLSEILFRYPKHLNMIKTIICTDM